MLKQAFRKVKGTLTNLVLSAVTALVGAFIGIYMISKVADIANIANTSDFYTVYTSLVTNTGTIYDVIILAIIIAVLAVPIILMRGFGRGGTVETPSI